VSVTPFPQEIHKERQVSDGLIEFEHCPVGTLTKKGEPRKTDWRAYHWTPTDGKRERMVSVSTVLDAIMPKPGLVPWSEAAGARGVMRAIGLGEVDPLEDSPDTAVRKMRSLRLGADAARDEAADRGIDIHALLEAYARTGTAPNPADFPSDRHGYIRALTRWLLHADPEPVAIEELVCSPEDGYAGRMDLIARSRGKLVAFDAKTSAKGQVFPGAHAQLRLYVKAHVRCGGEIPDESRIVAFAADGQFREMDCASIDIGKALQWYSALKPVNSACEAQNRVEREARKAA
jgi:hypothetical protein